MTFNTKDDANYTVFRRARRKYSVYVPIGPNRCTIASNPGRANFAGLYTDGLPAKPESYAYAFPDLLTFHDAPTAIEQTLFVMFLKHRMRAFQGAFHANPDYALWYGWSEMQRDLTEIKTLAAEMRHTAGQ